MAFQLTPEQEARIMSVIDRGEYQSAEQVVDAALNAFDQISSPPFEGTDAELKAMIVDGLTTQKLTEAEFREGVDSETARAIAEYQRRSRP